MPEDPKERETVSVEDLALSNAYQLEAMINVLERKGLLNLKSLRRPRERRSIEGDE